MIMYPSAAKVVAWGFHLGWTGDGGKYFASLPFSLGTPQVCYSLEMRAITVASSFTGFIWCL